MRGIMILSILIALLMTFFSVQNAQTVRVSFLGWFFDSPLAVVLLISFAAGALTSALASLPSRIRLLRELRESRRRLSPPPQGGETS